MNTVQIAGQLGRDMELKKVGEETVGVFSIADSQGKAKEAIWWNCSLWGSRSELLQKYLVKGTHVTVFGALTERSYVSKEGENKKFQEVRVSNVQLQGKSGNQSESDRPQSNKFSGVDEDLPF